MPLAFNGTPSSKKEGGFSDDDWNNTHKRKKSKEVETTSGAKSFLSYLNVGVGLKRRRNGVRPKRA